MGGALIARGLRKQFGERLAVDDVGFEIAAGEIYGLLGPNGAGKTTSISLISGVLPRDAGGSHSALRFGSAAIPELLRRVLDLGGRRKQLLAKIFGGAGMIEGSAGRLSSENIEIARHLLAEAQIPIVAEDVGGRQGRKLICRVRDGSAWVKLA